MARQSSGLVKKGKFVRAIMEQLLVEPLNASELFASEQCGPTIEYVQVNLDKLLLSNEVEHDSDRRYRLSPLGLSIAKELASDGQIIGRPSKPSSKVSSGFDWSDDDDITQQALNEGIARTGDTHNDSRLKNTIINKAPSEEIPTISGKATGTLARSKELEEMLYWAILEGYPDYEKVLNWYSSNYNVSYKVEPKPIFINGVAKGLHPVVTFKGK